MLSTVTDRAYGRWQSGSEGLPRFVQWMRLTVSTLLAPARPLQRAARRDDLSSLSDHLRRYCGLPPLREDLMEWGKFN
jgi:hypothetical protein